MQYLVEMIAGVKAAFVPAPRLRDREGLEPTSHSPSQTDPRSTPPNTQQTDGPLMSLINPTGLHHLRITVTDLARSRAFYQDVLGFTVVAESPGDPNDPQVRNDPAQLFGGVVFQTAGLIFGLRPVADPTDRFDSERVGLDHLSFSVGSLDELSSAAERLRQAGIEHGEVKELTNFNNAILSFSDPDGIHLELSAPL